MEKQFIKDGVYVKGKEIFFDPFEIHFDPQHLVSSNGPLKLEHLEKSNTVLYSLTGGGDFKSRAEFQKVYNDAIDVRAVRFNRESRRAFTKSTATYLYKAFEELKVDVILKMPPASTLAGDVYWKIKETRSFRPFKIESPPFHEVFFRTEKFDPNVIPPTAGSRSNFLKIIKPTMQSKYLNLSEVNESDKIVVRDWLMANNSPLQHIYMKNAVLYDDFTDTLDEIDGAALLLFNAGAESVNCFSLFRAL